MDEAALGSTVSIIGLVLQAAGALLLVVLFMLMRIHAGRRPFLRAWGTAWVMLVIALFVLVVMFILDPAIITRGYGEFSMANRFGFLGYMLFKLAFMQQLLVGTVGYARHHPSKRQLRASGIAVAILALLLTYLTDGINHIVTLQAPVIIAGMGVCAWLLLSLPAGRRSLGSILTGVLFATIALLWVGYLYTFQEPVLARFTSTGFSLPEVLGRYNSFIDLMLQMLLAYGMVLILMEDAKREIDSAHAELAIAHRELMSESLKDALTGVLNRRAYQLGTGLDHARASFGAMVVLDLDDLKQVNDRYGHAAGDELLRHFAGVLRSAMRPTDKLYRWGGDEFLMVMPRAQAAAVKQRILSLLRDAPPFVLGDDQRFSVKASVGAADYTDGSDMEAALRTADDEMYDLKRSRKSPGNTVPDAWKE